MYKVRDKIFNLAFTKFPNQITNLRNKYSTTFAML